MDNQSDGDMPPCPDCGTGVFRWMEERPNDEPYLEPDLWHVGHWCPACEWKARDMDPEEMVARAS